MSEPAEAMGEAHQVTVADDDAGGRLDAVLARHLATLSRARLQALIRAGRVTAEGVVVAEPSMRVKPGERVTVLVPPPAPATPSGEKRPLEILLEDEHLLVLVKPAGVVVHPAPGHGEGTLVNALIAHCGASLSGIGGQRRPGIVHRLDKDVSGVLVVAKHDRAHRGLAAQLTVHSVTRVYEAVVWGVPGTAAGTIDAPLGRDPANRLKMAVRADGKRAVTRYRLVAAAGLAAARLEVRLLTGRTHQIRVHLASQGHPLVGDRLYGRPGPAPAAVRPFLAGLRRILLHARELGFTHPITGEPVTCTAPAPAELARFLELLRP
jgi:23S rRNA pseudouridine1911/1915/1917 synthase